VRIFENIDNLCILVFALILLFAALMDVSYSLETTSVVGGPRAEDLIINFYPNVTAAYLALKSGQIDMIGYELDADLFSDAVDDANIVLAPVADQNMYEFDINNNCTIATYPGIRSPTNYQGFRQALAFLVDKDHIVDTICGGFAERIDQPIAAPHKGWRNESYWHPNYPYEYNPQAAANMLDAAGFVQGTTPNPHYDPSLAWSAPNLRTYPSDHPQKPSQDLDPIEICIRNNDLQRYGAGNILLDNMKKIGIPCNPTYGALNDMYDKVMWNMDYHIYTGSWSLGRFPPIYVHELYHSLWYYCRGPNYVTGYDCSGNPNYPLLDQLLDNAVYGWVYDEIVENMRKALGYFTEQCITIPLFSSISYYAWSADLLGVVNKEGVGPVNSYTFMNAYKASSEPITFGMCEPPVSVNVVESAWFYDYQCLDRMNLYSSLGTPPYDLSIDQAGFIQDWNINIWNDEGVDKTKVTKWLRSDSYFAEPVTGKQKANLNASHIFFTAWYLYQNPQFWASVTFEDIHHIDIVNNFQIDMYFNTRSYWDIYSAAYYIVPMDVFLQPPLSYNVAENFVEGINLTTPGVVNLSGKPVWINSVTADGPPLNMFSEYNIIGQGLSSGGKLEIFTNLTDNAVITVDYWSVGDASGYTAGDLPWQVVFEGAGMYYATAFTPGVGGSLTLKRNPYYWMQTPLLGEIDFAWKFETGPKPRSGSYKIDIYDVVTAVAAYGSQGTGIPDKNWLPGADLAPNGGTINIFDIVTTVSKYGEEWG